MCRPVHPECCRCTRAFSAEVLINAYSC
jgi:hypothetical protein